MMSSIFANNLRMKGFFMTSGALLYNSSKHGRTNSTEVPAHNLNANNITLYQYQSCPFCSKTRAFLDYYGIQYKKVEVNPLFKREMKFSSYKKVPFIVVDQSNDKGSTEGWVGTIQINDSSLLISVLRSSMVLMNRSLSNILDMYPIMKYDNEKEANLFERANKYFIMYGENSTDGRDVDQRREERQWREWVDTCMVHTLSPNIYRTPTEALQAFDYMSDVGNFSTVERVLAKYIGAIVMYAIAKKLRKKYKLKDDVRQSLYDCCDEWITAIGEHRPFMGGDVPNLADLAVYGIVNSIEGLDTFDNMISNTKMKKWYYAVKDRVIRQEGRTVL